MFYCGIDGGQTSTKCVIGTSDGQLIGRGVGGPLVHLSSQNGPQRFVASILEAIGEALANSNQRPAAEGASQARVTEFASIVVGATGIFEDTIEADTAVELLASQLQTTALHVCSDALIALKGAHAGGPGIMVISGTGTIAYGVDEQGTVERSGGWGWPLGDEGSAYAIGRAGLRAALHGADLLGPQTQLTDLVCNHFQVDRIHDVKRLYFAPDFGAPEFAALAPLVSQAVSQNDNVAHSIIRQNAEALANQAVAVATKLTLASNPIPVAPVGGAFAHVAGLRDSFEQALIERTHASNQLLRVQPPKLPPAIGAYLMALQQRSHTLTQELLSALAEWP